MDKRLSNTAFVAAIAIILICGLIILGSVVFYLSRSASQSSMQYFLTVNEVLNQKSNFMERNIRISGVVLGDTIQYDASALTLAFTIANVPADNLALKEAGGLEKVLHQAANDPNNLMIKVNYLGPKPELLRDEAQVIMTGKLGSDGIFHADEIMLRCPARYEETLPEQAQ